MTKGMYMVPICNIETDELREDYAKKMGYSGVTEMEDQLKVRLKDFQFGVLREVTLQTIPFEFELMRSGFKFKIIDARFSVGGTFSQTVYRSTGMQRHWIKIMPEQEKKPIVEKATFK